MSNKRNLDLNATYKDVQAITSYTLFKAAIIAAENAAEGYIRNSINEETGESDAKSAMDIIVEDLQALIDTVLEFSQPEDPNEIITGIAAAESLKREDI